MSQEPDDCIWIRTNVLLETDNELLARVETRKLCRDGVFLEYTGPVDGRAVAIVFPEPYTDGDGHHLFGTVTHRSPDGVWVTFRDNSLSPAEILMRAGPPLMEGARAYS